MTAPTSRERPAADACPGVGRPFVASDGSIVRLRPASRSVSVDALLILLDLVAGQDDPSIQLTSRGALQIRGLPDPLTPADHDALRSTGLMPSPTHEFVRNLVASPLSGLDGAGLCDVRHLAADLDRALCADPGLARLGGRFLFALDDGRGDVIGNTFDLGFVATGRDQGVVLAGSSPDGWVVSLDDAVPTIAALAREFVTRTDTEPVWHVDELTEPFGPARTGTADTAAWVTPARPLGAVGEHAVVAVPLGLLRREHVDALAHVADKVRVTPWRSLVVEDGAASLPDLEAAGLATHEASPWHRLHACTGLPGCARSALDTRTLARALAPVLPPGRLPVHVSGCERRCGTPATAYVDLLAPRSLDDALALVRSSEPPPPRRVPTSPPGGSGHPRGSAGGTSHSTGRSETSWT